jgi:hypothetical protein
MVQFIAVRCQVSGLRRDVVASAKYTGVRQRGAKSFLNRLDARMSTAGLTPEH